MASLDSEPSAPLDHSELISVLNELYTLFDPLSAIPSTSSALPPLDTGVYPSGDFDADSAIAADFSQGAVRVLSMISYPGSEQEFEPRTTAFSYLGTPGWNRQRALIYGLDEGAPPSAIKPTDGGEGMGFVYVYDAETRLMHAWVALYPVPVDDDEKRHMSLDYFRALCSMSPRKALQPLINKFCSLYYINCPPWAGTEHELVYEQSAFLLRDRADFSDKSEFEPLANLSFCRNVHEETSPGDGRGLCQLHFAAIWWAGDVQTVNQMILEHRNDCYTKKPRFPASSACR